MKKMLALFFLCVFLLTQSSCYAAVIEHHSFVESSPERFKTYHVTTSKTFNEVTQDFLESFYSYTHIPFSYADIIEFRWYITPQSLIARFSGEFLPNSYASWLFFTTEQINDHELRHFTYSIPLHDDGEMPEIVCITYDDQELAYTNDLKARKADYEARFGSIDNAAQQLEQLYGPYFLWTYTLKAEFYEQWGIIPYTEYWYVDRFPISEIWTLPTDHVISCEEAVALARSSVQQNCSLSDEMMDLLYEDVRYDGEQWNIMFWLLCECGGIYVWSHVCGATISNDGEIIGSGIASGI